MHKYCRLKLNFNCKNLRTHRNRLLPLLNHTYVFVGFFIVCRSLWLNGKKLFVKHTRMGTAPLNSIMKTLLLLNTIINYIRTLFAIRLHMMIQNERKKRIQNRFILHGYSTKKNDGKNMSFFFYGLKIVFSPYRNCQTGVNKLWDLFPYYECFWFRLWHFDEESVMM